MPLKADCVEQYALGGMQGTGACLLGPPVDGVLCQDVAVVQHAHDVCEQLQQLAVLIAAHLHSRAPSASSLGIYLSDTRRRQTPCSDL